MAVLHCNNCGKVVSTAFTPAPTDTPDRGLIVRAWIECPECIEKNDKAPVAIVVRSPDGSRVAEQAGAVWGGEFMVNVYELEPGLPYRSEGEAAVDATLVIKRKLDR